MIRLAHAMAGAALIIVVSGPAWAQNAKSAGGPSTNGLGYSAGASRCDVPNMTAGTWVTSQEHPVFDVGPHRNRMHGLSAAPRDIIQSLLCPVEHDGSADTAPSLDPGEDGGRPDPEEIRQALGRLDVQALNFFT